MRMRLLTAAGTLALALAAPSAALAHHGHGRHHHRAHHARFHVIHIGSSSSGTGSPTTAAENAGTVASYEREVLTIALSGGSTISGKVSADTHIRCIGATAASEQGDWGSGQDGDSDDDWHHGHMSDRGDWGGDDNWGGKGADGGQQPAPEPPCDTSSLVAGTVVRGAQLRISASGGEFECVVLVRSS